MDDLTPTEAPASLASPAALPVPRELLTWAKLPGSAALLARVRTKLERGHRGNRVVAAADLSPAHRVDIGRLLGRRWEVSGAPVTLGQLRTALAGAAGQSDGDLVLEALLVTTSGPLRDLPAERRAADEVRSSQRGQVVDVLEGAGVPAAVAGLAVRRHWFGDGPTAVEAAGRVARLFTYLADLPEGATRLLAEAATHLYADPHALDRNRVLGRASARVLAAAQATRAGADPDDLVPASGVALASARWREVWEAAGVMCDRLSATVLALNIPLIGDASAVALSGVVGEPVWLTARSFSGPWAPAAGLRLVRVCENPSVVETAADALGTRCLPLVCTYGRPSTAAHTLLAGLHAAGVGLLVSADRDAAGDQISREILARYPGAAPWAPELEGVYEEERLSGLLADLTAEVD